jgi:hypothetical protein
MKLGKHAGEHRLSIYYSVVENEGTSSPVSDVDRYVTIRKLLDSMFSILPVFLRRLEIQTYSHMAYARYDGP